MRPNNQKQEHGNGKKGNAAEDYKHKYLVLTKYPENIHVPYIHCIHIPGFTHIYTYDAFGTIVHIIHITRKAYAPANFIQKKPILSLRQVHVYRGIQRVAVCG